MPWLNGKKTDKNCCKFCGSPFHRGWQCKENPKNIAKLQQVPKTKPKSLSVSPRTSKRSTKKRSKNIRSKLIKDYDNLFSKYVRLKAQLENNLFCFTCGKRLTYEEAVVMHFISRRFISTRFNVDNVHVGCRKCNTPDKDQPAVLAKYAALLGEETVNRLNELKTQKISTPELQEQYHNLQRTYKALQELDLLSKN